MIEKRSGRRSGGCGGFGLRGWKDVEVMMRRVSWVVKKIVVVRERVEEIVLIVGRDGVVDEIEMEEMKRVEVGRRGIGGLLGIEMIWVCDEGVEGLLKGREEDKWRGVGFVRLL